MDLYSRCVGIWIVCVIYIAVSVEGANYDEACIVDGDCTGKNAEKCDSSTSKCICSDGFFLNITAAECAAKIVLKSNCDAIQTATDQCSIANSECTDDGTGTYKCLCKPTHYETKGGVCALRIFPGANCAANQCVNHAYCNTTTNPNECQCKTGYTASPTAKPTMCSGVFKVASMLDMLAVPIFVSMMSLLR